MSSKDKANLLAILDAIDRVNEYTKGLGSPEDFFKSSVVFDASLMNFINIWGNGRPTIEGTKGSHVELIGRRSRTSGISSRTTILELMRKRSGRSSRMTYQFSVTP